MPKAEMSEVAVVQPSGDHKSLEVKVGRGEVEQEVVGRMAADPAVNAGVVMQRFTDPFGADLNLMSMISTVKEITARVKAGDLSDMEAMLVGQTVALQSMFVDLARRSKDQKLQRNAEAFLGLAFKAQAQSRSTISALVDLKYPRQQATFVKQANINNGGQQQVNNGVSGRLPDAPAHGEEIRNKQSKLLEADHGGTYLDSGATATATRGDPAMAALATLDRAQQPSR